MGKAPRLVRVILDNDLVDLCKAGDDVTVNATVIERWGKLVTGAKNQTEIILHANYIRVNNADESYVNITPAQVRIRSFKFFI